MWGADGLCCCYGGQDTWGHSSSVCVGALHACAHVSACVCMQACAWMFMYPQVHPLMYRHVCMDVYIHACVCMDICEYGGVYARLQHRKPELVPG